MKPCRQGREKLSGREQAKNPKSWLRAVRSRAHAGAQDKTKRELVDLKNQADSLAYQSEKQLKDAPADKLPADVKSKARTARCWGGLGRAAFLSAQGLSSTGCCLPCLTGLLLGAARGKSGHQNAREVSGKGLLCC